MANNHFELFFLSSLTQHTANIINFDICTNVTLLQRLPVYIKLVSCRPTKYSYMPKFKKYTYVTVITRTKYNNSIKYYKICSSALKFWTKNIKKSTNADCTHYCSKRYTFQFGEKINFF